MAQTFQSGAFIQQCFASHRLCLTIKKLALPEKILLACTSCNMLHRLTVRALTAHAPAARAVAEGVHGGDEAADCLRHCLAAHQTALGVREVDVLQDSVGLRCAECRRSYDLDVAAFETHQR